MTSEPASTPAVTEPAPVAVEPQDVVEAAPDASKGEVKDSDLTAKEGTEKDTAESETPAQEGNEDEDEDFPRFEGGRPRAPVKVPVSGPKGSKPSIRR